MLGDEPTLTIPAVNVREASLHGGSVCEGEGVDPRVDRDIAKGADVRLVDFSRWLFSQEMDEVVLNFWVVVAHLIGYGWQQDSAGFVEGRYLFRIPGLERGIPFFEKVCNRVVSHILKVQCDVF